LRLTVIIPTYKEDPKTLNELISRIPFPVIVVDDSPEPPYLPQATVIARRQRLGLSSAVLTALPYVDTPYVAVMDGDLQHPPEVLSSLLDKAISRCDFVVACRSDLNALPVHRRIISFLANHATHLLVPSSRGIADPMSGFFLCSTEKAKKASLLLPRNNLGFKIMLWLLAYGDFEKVGEVKYHFAQRQGNKSKAGLKQGLLLMRQLIILFFRAGAGKVNIPTRNRSAHAR
jgi:dolichol-phosphate mannosyltransferase